RLIRIAAAEFGVYLESPSARMALVAATALVNHARLDAPGVTRAMQEAALPTYRVWAAPRTGEYPNVVMKRISIRGTGGGEIQPIEEWHERFWVGTVPSHGIPEALRSRTPEYV